MKTITITINVDGTEKTEIINNDIPKNEAISLENLKFNIEYEIAEARRNYESIHGLSCYEYEKLIEKILSYVRGD